MVAAGKDVSAYDRAKLMSVDYDNTELAQAADDMIRTFQADASREAGCIPSLDYIAYLPHNCIAYARIV
jgi:hypothetical protein